MPAPRIRLQTATLYASNDESWFEGTGGPWGFSPWTSQFGGIVGSAGLAAEPFADTVFNVAAGDEVIFVIAVENLAPGAQAFDIQLRATMPPGFVLPDDGANLAVTDGAGTDLAIAGDLFGPTGLTIASPLAGTDPDSGRNIALLTYTLQAGPALPAPEATLVSRAELLHVAATPGGPDLAAASPTAPATTTIVTAAPAPVVVPLTDPAAVARGQLIAFDTSVTLPQGTLRDLRIDTLLPQGAASLSLVSVAVTGVGSGLRLGAPKAGLDGGIDFGDVVNPSATGDAATITLHVVLRANGAESGPATFQTVLSAADPNRPGGRWSSNAASSVGVIVPPPPPTIADIWTAQRATTTMLVHPFGGVTLTGGDRTRPATIAITQPDSALGRFEPVQVGALDSTGRTWVATGSIDQLQAMARTLIFNPDAVGTARFTLTLIDGGGAVAQNAAAAVAISPSADALRQAEHFAPAPGSAFMTATADGQQTLAAGETYQGPVSYLQGQYIYDGWEPVAIVARTPNVFVKNFVGDAAVALLSGQNVVDAGKGSNFLIGGTGDDVFFLDGRSDAVTWNTIVGFNRGDIATLFGFGPTSSYWWDESDGAPGYTGRTLRSDLHNAGHPTASITFAGADRSVTDTYALTTGQIGGIDYMTIFAL